MTSLLVALGGALGAVLRYWVVTAVQGATGGGFPWGTLTVNVCGSLVIGIVSAVAERRGYLSADARAFVVAGVLGGFTTFSAFANESVNALRDGAASMAFVNVAVSVVSCLGAVWLGRGLVGALVR